MVPTDTSPTAPPAHVDGPAWAAWIARLRQVLDEAPWQHGDLVPLRPAWWRYPDGQLRTVETVAVRDRLV